MHYINTSTLEYPIYRSDLVKANPNAVFPVDQPLDVVGYQFVHSTVKPVGDVVIEGQPVLVDGQYHQVWITRGFNSYEIEQFKAKKQNSIDQDFKDAISTLKNGYTEDEIKSWDKQEQEARAYISYNLSPTPLLSAMSAARGDTVAELAAKVVSNSDLWTSSYGSILGTKHAREANLKAIDPLALDALTQIENV